MNAMKQIILSAATLFLAADNSFAQTFSNTPNDSVQMTGMLEDLETLSIQQLNISSDTIHLKWKKVSESVPALWEVLICDNSICHTSLVDSGMMNPVIPGDYGLLLLHIIPHVNYGTAIIRYAVWDVANATNKDTLTYILTVNTALGITGTEYQNDVRIFPNPANHTINIITSLQTGFIFSIADFSGKEIQTGISKTNAIVASLINIPDGAYNISISENKETLLTKKIIILH